MSASENNVAVRLRGWPHGIFPEQVARPHHPSARPLGVAFSGGGFRSFGCSVGQLRALHALGLADHIGTIGAVSGGAWAATAYAFAQHTDDDTMLGVTTDTAQLTLEAIDHLDEGHLAYPVTHFDTLDMLTSLSDSGVPNDQLFGSMLAKTVLEPLGIEAHRPWLAADSLHAADLRARNPGIGPDDILVPRADRPFVVVGASLIREPGSRQWYVPMELSAMYATVPPDLTLDHDVALVETAGLATNGLNRQRTGLYEAEIAHHGISLADIWGAAGNAPGGILARFAKATGYHLDAVVPRVTSWVSPEMPEASPLVDGGYLENTGIASLLRRGFDRMVVFVNSSRTVDGLYTDTVDGVDGQISRLFGRPPSHGAFKDESLRLFPPSDLDALVQGFRESQARGEMPWHLGTHRIVPMNPLGLVPRTVQVLWMNNELPKAWAAELPEDTQAALRFTGVGGGLTRFPHFSAAFANTDMFRLKARQITLLGHMWDHAVRARRAELEQLVST